jgi:hypothetical protein
MKLTGQVLYLQVNIFKILYIVFNLSLADKQEHSEFQIPNSKFQILDSKIQDSKNIRAFVATLQIPNARFQIPRSKFKIQKFKIQRTFVATFSNSKSKFQNFKGIDKKPRKNIPFQTRLIKHNLQHHIIT